MSSIPSIMPRHRHAYDFSMSFTLYIFGLAVLLAGIAWGLITAGLALTYVVIACLVVAGLGIMMAVSRTRTKDPPAS
jgi:Zn-dependent protease with chaperone function